MFDAAIYPSFNLIPNEVPLSDEGRWGEYGRPPLQVSTDGFSIHSSIEFAVNGSVYVEKVFNGAIIEGYGCAPGAGLGAAVESHRIFALVGDPNAFVGYASGYGGAIGEEYIFRRYGGSAAAFVGIGDGGAADGGVGPFATGPSDGLGIRILPDRVQQWGQYGGEWHLIQTAFDTTYRGTVWFALETEQEGGIEEVYWSCFGAGVPNRTQIYRLVRGLATVEV